MKPALASLYQALAFDKEIPPLLIGERANSTGSKKFRDRLLAGDDDGCLAVLKEQERGGADILDLSVAYAGRNETEDMVRLIKKAALQLSVPLMIDSTQPAVIEAALKNYPGRPIVNSVNLEKGIEALRENCRLIARYGAAAVALTIDEEGMALTAERKTAVAERIAAEAFACGLREKDLFFDPLTFTLASGDVSYANSGMETLNAIEMIKKRFPQARTVLGVSNVSFGLPPQARRVLNSVFLAEAVKRGLDAAIIDPSKVIPLGKIDPELRNAALDLIENRRFDALQRLTGLFNAAVSVNEGRTEDLSGEERLRRAVIDGDKTALEQAVEDLLPQMPAETILNDLLLEAMKEVGELFGKGEMLLPFVLQSAETLRRGVDLLKPRLSAGAGKTQRPCTVLLATVAGDVHDIGKNLVGMILENNGFTVCDIGVKASAELIAEKASECGADLIGLSGLLVKSALIMKEDLTFFQENKMKTPVLLGGAALTESFVGNECAPLYDAPVIYCADAFATLKAAAEWRESGSLPRLIGKSVLTRSVPKESQTAEGRRLFSAHPKPTVPFIGSRIIESISFEEWEPALARRALYGSRWKLTGADEEAEKVYRRLCRRYGDRLGAGGVYGFFPCAADGNRLVVRTEPPQTFTFPRIGRTEKIALSDFYNTDADGGDIFAAVVATLGGGWDEELSLLRQKGELTESFYLYGFLAEAAEAVIETIQRRILSETGTEKRNRVRFSPGYPACDLSQQQPLFALLQPERIGVRLTESMMMDPEFTVSAVIPLSSDARYW